MHTPTQTPAEAITAYIRAKDGNRPHLLNAAFAKDASLHMQVKTNSITFPPACLGRESIAETLVRRFNQSYENVYTFCLGAPPVSACESFSCDWLVAMSEKQGGALRVGCGRYDWTFSGPLCQVSALHITIEAMDTLPAATLEPVLAWVASLPYPWCGRASMLASAPDLVELQAALSFLRQAKAQAS